MEERVDAELSWLYSVGQGRGDAAGGVVRQKGREERRERMMIEAISSRLVKETNVVTISGY